jgi:hypothetical protein
VTDFELQVNGVLHVGAHLAEEYSESENQLESRMEWGMERLEIQSTREKPKMRGLPKVFFINQLFFSHNHVGVCICCSS